MKKLILTIFLGIFLTSISYTGSLGIIDFLKFLTRFSPSTVNKIENDKQEVVAKETEIKESKEIKTRSSVLAVVNLQEVFVNYGAAKKIQAQYKSKEDAFKQKFEKMQTELQAVTDETQQKQLSEKYRKELEAEQKSLLEFNKQSTEKIEKDILAAVKKIAQSKSIDYVVDKQAVLDGGLDITQDVLKELN